VQDNNVPAPAHQSADVGTNGVYKIGGDVSAPVLVYSVAPQVSEKERKVWVDGNVLVNIYVDVKGNPSHVRVVRGLAPELDESAVEAVRQYHFKPAMKNGKPVLVQINVEINFQKR
jgi:periplasmic protein TonB